MRNGPRVPLKGREIGDAGSVSRPSRRGGRAGLAAACLLALVARPAVAADVINPHVTTDRSVDTSSVEAMVRSIVTPGMTDREKALAVYNFVRRTMFHYRYLTDYAGGGTMDLINGVGYCLCTPTAGTQARLATVAGLTGHVLTTPGHGSVTINYDGAWHWMDAFLGGCVWNQDRTAIASLDEIVADPSLLRRENASPVPLFPCGAVLYDDALRWEPTNTEYHKQCGPDDLAWTSRAKPGEHKPMVWDDASSLAITLRPGETFARFWDHEPGMYFLFRTEQKYAPPHHICGVEAEERDTINWPYWKPYVKEITSTDARTGRPRTVKTGRYWANGRLTWKPDLAAPDLLGQFALAQNVRVDGKAGGLVPVDPARPAVLEWAVACPFMLQGGWLRAQATGTLRATVRTDARRNGRPASSTPTTGPGMPSDRGPAPLALAERDGRLEGALREHFARNIGTRGYTLRLELSGPDARIAGLELVTVFQHNMYALPQLMPGPNGITVTLANPEALKTARFVLEYAWDEAGQTKVERREIDRSPLTFAVTVPGADPSRGLASADLPRMRRLVLANEGAR